MSAPTSGSSGSSAASPVPGYYPDPSIPNYIRYWNGSAWVPGTSRPAPLDGEMPPAGPAPSPPGPAPAVDESGLMYLDEDPSAPRSEGPAAFPPPLVAGDAPAVPGQGGPASAPEVRRDPRAEPRAAEAPPLRDRPGPDRPGPAGGAATAPVPGTAPAPAPAPAWPEPGPRPEPPPLTWGVPRQQSAEPEQAGPGAYRAPASPPPRPGPQPGPQAQPQPHVQPQPQPRPEPHPRPEPQAGPPAGGQAPPWAAQVRELAQQGGAGAEPVVPWRPVATDPFASAAGHDRPAGLGRRLVARLVDSVLLGAVTAAVAVPLGRSAYHHDKAKVDAARQSGRMVRVWLLDGTTGAQLAAVIAVVLVAGLLLEVLPTARWGRTLGKKLVGLKVLDIEAQLPPSFWASLRRWLTRTVLNALVVGVAGVAWCLFDRPWKQCWHDKAARTFVAAG